jgi:hypothetical protein
MRIDELPVMETHLIKNAEAPGGIGEAPTAIVSAAVTNAADRYDFAEVVALVVARHPRAG